jgi:hypothetical protein
MDDAERQAIIDDEQLRLLSIGYIVSGVLSVFMSLFGLLYAGMGAMIAAMPESSASSPGEAEMMGTLFGTIGVVMFVLLLALAIAKFRVASQLKKRRSKTLCMVVAAVTCIGIPWGTLLGVSTFIVLGRGSVERQFRAGGPAAPA